MTRNAVLILLAGAMLLGAPASVRADGDCACAPCESAPCQCAGDVSGRGCPAVLNALQVRTLVARGDAADHRALSGHFGALASRYAAAAARHEQLARVAGGNPNHPQFWTSHSAAAADQRAATAILAELAAHHARAAAGAPSSAPSGAAEFWAGTGARTPSRAELQQAGQAARLRREHRDLAEYFNTLARRQETVAVRHEALSAAYRGTRIAQAAVHCDRAARAARDEAEWAAARALVHEQFAAIAGVTR